MPAHKETVKKVSNRRAFKDMSIAQKQLAEDLGLLMFWMKNTLTPEQEESLKGTLENTRILKNIIKQP